MIKLLIVDDEKGLCGYLKELFSPIGFTVLTATDGQEAIALAEKEKPKLVILDIKMLGISGLDVLKEIKTLDRNIKVIMVTALDDEKIKDEALKLGADEFITKPFLSDHLEEVVRRQVGDLIKGDKL